MNKFTKQEELANSISHLSGALLAIAAQVLMVSYSTRYGTTLHVVSTSIFGASLIVLYSTSGIAHALSPGRKKDMFFNLDRVAIYILIAGSYTPISLVALNGTVGWILFYKVFRFPFHHLVWHLLVLAGSASHFFAVFLYIIPR